MPSVEVDGISVYYEEMGTGQATVFVHGIPTDHRAWTKQMGPLSDSRRVVAISRRCAWPNPPNVPTESSTVEANAGDLEKFIVKMGLAPADIVGHSYGGFAAAYLAARNPKLVRRLVLVEPAVSTLLLKNEKSKSEALGLLLRSPSVALAARRFQKTSLYPSYKALEKGDMDEAVELNVDGVQDAPGEYAKFDPETRKMMKDNARTVGELKTVFPKFYGVQAAGISSPTLILNGEKSPLWLRRIGETLNTKVRGSTRVIVPNSRHFPHMENPIFFNDRVKGFLEAE